MKKQITTIMAVALANAFATSPQIQNSNKNYDILGRHADKVSAQRVIKSVPTEKASLAENTYQYNGFNISRPAAYIRPADANTLAVGQDINFPYTKKYGPYATPKAARKDTKLLVLGWGKHINEYGWDVSHTDRPHWDDEEAYRCWTVAAQIMNHAYMKKLGKNMNEQSPNRMLMTQDEIKYHVFHDMMDASNYTPVNDFPLAANGSARTNDIVSKALNFALGTEKSKFYGDIGGDKEFAEWSNKYNVKEYIKTKLTNGYPVVIGEGVHIMVIDAYVMTSNGTIWVRLLNPNNDGSFQWRTLNSVDICGIAVIDQSSLNPQYSDPFIHQDTDNDGLMDFDEINRFKTNYKSWDSDGDHVSDKEEIRAYTLRALPKYVITEISSDPSENPNNMWYNTTITNAGKNYWADADGNGVSAQNDSKEQGNNTFSRLPIRATEEAPDGFNIYALESINIQKNAQLVGAITMGSEKSSSATTITVSGSTSGSILDIYTQGGVVANGGAKIRFLEKFSDNNNINVSLTNGSAITGFQDNNPRNCWLWQVEKELPSVSSGAEQLTVKSGSTYRLTNNARLSVLRVLSGATLEIGAGEMYVKTIYVADGATVKYVNGSKSVKIHATTVTWNAKNSTSDASIRKNIATQIKLIQHGSKTVNIKSGWYGSIFAPNSDVNVGSNGGQIFGKIVGKNINMASGTVYNSAYTSSN